VLITGGSSGLGRAIGISAAQQGKLGQVYYPGYRLLITKIGANVVILARDVNKLDEARKQILKNRKSETQQVEMYSVDLGNAGAVCALLISD
jgi:short-subunit dehydrogenase